MDFTSNNKVFQYINDENKHVIVKLAHVMVIEFDPGINEVSVVLTNGTLSLTGSIAQNFYKKYTNYLASIYN